MFASEDVFEIVPILLLAMATSGYQPLAATILSNEIYEVISQKGVDFLHGMTYSGHQSLVQHLKNIEVMEKEGIPESSQNW